MVTPSPIKTISSAGATGYTHAPCVIIGERMAEILKD
jgi:hypothetical protein